MALLPTIKRLTREDLKEAPPWIERLIYPLNLFMDAVWTALNHGLTFAENIRSQEKTFQITAAATAALNTTSFACTMRTIPKRMLVGNVVDITTGNYVTIGAAVFVEWRYNDGNILITSITGLTNGNLYEFTVTLI